MVSFGHCKGPVGFMVASAPPLLHLMIYLCVFLVPLGAILVALAAIWAPLGHPWGSLGAPLDTLGDSVWQPWRHFGILGVPFVSSFVTFGRGPKKDRKRYQKESDLGAKRVVF